MSSTPAFRLTPVQWLICTIAAIGFAFDIYELLMLPLIVKTAIADLHPQIGTPQDWAPGGQMYVSWARTLFFVPAIAGGVFGLLGGYLTDRLGRRSVLTWSILLYAFGACAAGFSTSLTQLLFFRCCVFVGVCVEFVAAVAWLAELFPNHEQREKVLGYTQAFSSLGGVLVAVMAKLAAQYADLLPAIHGTQAAWRYTLISGLIPAIPLILIRPFLPESPAWQKKRQEGTLKRPSILALFNPELRKTTIVTTLVFATTFGLAFGAIQQNPQILAGHVDVQKAVTEAQAAATTKAEAEGKPLTPKDLGVIKGNTTDKLAAGVQGWQEIGGLFGRLILAWLAVRFVSRGTVPSLPDSKPVVCSISLLVVVKQPQDGRISGPFSIRNFYRRLIGSWPDEFLGQLHSVGLSSSSSWDWRELCSQHWRSSPRHSCRFHHAHAFGFG